MAINVYVKFSYDRLRIDKELGNLLKSDYINKNKNNVPSTWGLFPCPKTKTFVNVNKNVTFFLNLFFYVLTEAH